MADTKISALTAASAAAGANEIPINEAGTTKKITLTQAALFSDSRFNAPQGFLINGKIVPSVASNNLTVAIKTLAGANPSATDPIYCRIGDTVRSITAALSVTKNAGTNWCNSGSSELATKEIDYFTYLGYNATDGVVIGFSRFPGASQYSDFSTTSTNEKYCAISTITNAASTDYYEIIGRFAATLSAGAGYTWTVPTFTAINLIQKQIYETRWLTWVPQYTGFSVNPSSVTALYKILNDLIKCRLMENGNGTSNSTSKGITFPFAAKGAVSMGHVINTVDNGTQAFGKMIFSNTNSPAVYPSVAVATWTASGNCRIETLGAPIEYGI